MKAAPASSQVPQPCITKCCAADRTCWKNSTSRWPGAGTDKSRRAKSHGTCSRSSPCTRARSVAAISGCRFSTRRNFDDAPRLTDRQREAMALFDEIASSDDFRFSMMFEPGDMQLLNNHVMLHSRTAFEDFPEEDRKRHLLRMWLSVSKFARIVTGHECNLSHADGRGSTRRLSLAQWPASLSHAGERRDGLKARDCPESIRACRASCPDRAMFQRAALLAGASRSDPLHLVR